ncbi:unnamed protein product, partial [Mesorhabditis belari]|uniref:PDZ domain-containing protein n=1 Tax=Mesorhabditis belari TaxID=2138241 RepID=A0AAF3FD14_9BILA
MQSLAVLTIKVDVPDWDRKKQGNFIELGPQMRVAFVSDKASFAIDKLAFGDLIQKVNGKPIMNPFECEDLLHEKGERTIQIQRDVNVQPILTTRLNALSVKRRPQFGYLLISVGQGDKTKDQPVGIVVAAKNDRIYIGQVVKSSVAENILQAGDAILDIDDKPIKSDIVAFTKQIGDLMRRVGKFTCAIERPIFDHIARAIADDVTKKPCAANSSMSPDALEIGCRAAREFLRVDRFATPKSILIPTKMKTTKEKKEKSGKEKQRLAWKENISRVVEIGTNIPPDQPLVAATRDSEPETSLRSIKRVRMPFFEDYYDVL